MIEAAEALNLGMTDRILGLIPFFHIYGLVAIVHHAVHGGYKTVVMPRFAMRVFSITVQERKITVAYLAPPVVLALSKSPTVNEYNLSSIKTMSSAAAPLTEELAMVIYESMQAVQHGGFEGILEIPCFDVGQGTHCIQGLYGKDVWRSHIWRSEVLHGALTIVFQVFSSDGQFP